MSYSSPKHARGLPADSTSLLQTTSDRLFEASNDSDVAMPVSHPWPGDAHLRSSTGHTRRGRLISFLHVPLRTFRGRSTR